MIEQLPPSAQRLIQSSADLYARIKRIDEGQLDVEPVSQRDTDVRAHAR